MTRTDKAGSQQWTAVSLLLELVSTVERRYVTPAKEPTHINYKMTRSLYQVLTCAPKHALPQHVFRSARRSKCHDWCLEKQKKNNVAGQGQPKHLNIQNYSINKVQNLRKKEGKYLRFSFQQFFVSKIYRETF